MNFSSPIRIEKPWGYELIIHNDKDYCGKLLHIRAGNNISLQYHKLKSETFYLQSGSLLCKFSEQETFISPGETKIVKMKPGDVKEIPAGYIHQVYAVEDSVIFEVSTQHFDDDTYRLCLSF